MGILVLACTLYTFYAAFNKDVGLQNPKWHAYVNIIVVRVTVIWLSQTKYVLSHDALLSQLQLSYVVACMRMDFIVHIQYCLGFKIQWKWLTFPHLSSACRHRHRPKSTESIYYLAVLDTGTAPFPTLCSSPKNTRLLNWILLASVSIFIMCLTIMSASMFPAFWFWYGIEWIITTFHFHLVSKFLFPRFLGIIFGWVCIYCTYIYSYISRTETKQCTYINLPLRG